MRDQPSPCLVTFLCLGRCGRYHEEGQAPPSPKGVNPRSRRTRLSADLLGARAEEVPSWDSCKKISGQRAKGTLNQRQKQQRERSTEHRKQTGKQANKSKHKGKKTERQREQTKQRKTRLPEAFGRLLADLLVFAPVSPELRASSKRPPMGHLDEFTSAVRLKPCALKPRLMPRFHIKATTSVAPYSAYTEECSRSRFMTDSYIHKPTSHVSLEVRHDHPNVCNKLNSATGVVPRQSILDVGHL